MAFYLGLDTSNYTTSLAVVDENGNIVVDERIVLRVNPGKLGLRQSEAVFQHLKNLPVLFERIFTRIDRNKIRAIGVSDKPRPEEDSYMPVFMVGLNTARILSGALDVPLIKTTHQEGHIMAGLWSVKDDIWEKFNVIHISGGTTEVLEISLNQWEPFAFNIKKIGGTTDLHAGQFIDRIGVKMGLPFPSGQALEKLAQKSLKKIEFPVSVKGLSISLSGPESHGQRLIEKGENHSDIARGVENCLTQTLVKLILNSYNTNNLKDFLLVGGVASNSYLRTILGQELKNGSNCFNLLFANSSLSSDNAVGVSLIAKSADGGVVRNV